MTTPAIKGQAAEAIRSLFAHIARGDTTGALEHYSEDYEFFVAFEPKIRFNKTDMAGFLDWDRTLGTVFELTRLDSIDLSDSESWVFVDMKESSVFYSLIGNQYRRTKMMFHVAGDAQLRRSLVLSTVDEGRPVMEGIADLVSWVARNEPEALAELPIPPAGSPQGSRPVRFDSASAEDWLRLARLWNDETGQKGMTYAKGSF